MRDSDTRLLFEAYQTMYVPQIIEEGGAYGHMANVHEDYMLTFGDLDEIIRQCLSGNVKGEMKEKTDGQAIAMSYARGKVLFARNKGHYINRGANALKGSKGVIDMFAGHPNNQVAKAFEYAAKDLERAIKSLDDTDKAHYFGEGSRWVNIEIIWPETVNVIPYNHKLLVLHNYREYDEDGNVVGGDFNEYGKDIAELLERTNENVQDKFTITSMPILKLPKVEQFTDQIPTFTEPLTDLQQAYGLNSENTIGDYWVSYLSAQIKNTQLPVAEDVIHALAYRWAFKSLTPAKRPKDWSNTAIQRLTDLKKLTGTSGQPVYEWARNFETNLKQTHEQMVLPIKDTFLRLGVIVVKNMTNLLTLNPEKAIQQIRRSLEEVIQQVGDGGDPDLEAKIAKELAQIEKAGGMDAIVPTEGLTFTYTPIGQTEQKIFKFTGIFAPINQILGVRFGNR